MIYAALTQFKIKFNLRIFFRQICTPKVSEFTKTKVLSQSGSGEINGRYDYGQRSIICLIFLFTPSLTSFINLSYYCLYQNKSLSRKIHTTFIKQQMDFKRPVFAMAVLQASFSLTHWLTDSSFSYCVTWHLSGISICLEVMVFMYLVFCFLFFWLATYIF